MSSNHRSVSGLLLDPEHPRKDIGEPVKTAVQRDFAECIQQISLFPPGCEALKADSAVVAALDALVGKAWSEEAKDCARGALMQLNHVFSETLCISTIQYNLCELPHRKELLFCSAAQVFVGGPYLFHRLAHYRRSLLPYCHAAHACLKSRVCWAHWLRAFRSGMIERVAWALLKALARASLRRVNTTWK